MKLDLIDRIKSIRYALKYANDPITGMLENFEKYGETYSGYLGAIQPMMVTKNPEIVRHVLQKNHRNYIKTPMIFDKLRRFLGNGLLTSEGSYWLQQRRLIQPGFHRQRLEALVEIMDRVIIDSEKQLAGKEEMEIDIYPMMMRLAFDMVSRSLFSTAIEEKKLDFLSNSLTTLQSFLVQQIRQPYLNPWFRISGQLQEKLKLSQAADDILLDIISQRRASQEEHHDLLQMLLESRYEETGEGMTDQQLLDESNIIITAGHETSANALSWIFYLLAQHPLEVEKLRMELETVLGDRRPNFADLRQLPYTTQVIEEGMRLYPPAWITDRQSVADDEINGVHIPKGTMVVLMIYALHHDPQHWSDPAAFRPERFAPEAKKKLPPYTYLPFGGGPRLCIGNNFAMMEMQLVLAHYIRRYDVSLVPGEEVEMLPLVTLRPKKGIQLLLRRIV